MKGVLDKDYAIARQTKRSHIYRLKRRTFEVLKGIETFHPETPQSILDIGTADGLMLSNLKDAFPDATCAGIEYARDLMACCESKIIHLIQGDAVVLPIKDNVFDVVIATAIIEHVSEPVQLVREAFRVLRKKGILIMTTPHPFWERFATHIGHLKEEEHHELVTLNKLKSLFDTAGFEIANAQKFMISPVGMPFELTLEKIMKLCRLNFLLLNQIIVGRKMGIYTRH
ncbi:MAG TPA: class I SAM-dependent methyltransferase [Candidatus Wunengus sp. YC60]|uniref:class I SAM-dependent methyltransferase n=1 Tax=Candidatus Wunengus sp. YC60 TaxID=3367697 RepID=UPI0040285C84